jgi:alanine racemase
LEGKSKGIIVNQNPSPVSWAEIDLDAIAENVRAIKQSIGPKVELIAVVKANAYGHGAEEVSPIMLANGASRLTVHRLQEAISLRRAGIRAPILILGYIPPSDAPLVVQWDLTPSVMHRDFACALHECAVSQKRTVPSHIEVDTGLGRYGVLPDEFFEFWKALEKLSSLKVEGLYTHFASADASDSKFTLEQLAVFENLIDRLREAGVHIPLIHAANSAAMMRLPQTRLNAVRDGIALYGLKPSIEWESPIELKPALSLKSIVARIRVLPSGWTVGYGRTYVCNRPTKVALIPLGYGDGYHRSISLWGAVLIRGQRAP